MKKRLVKSTCAFIIILVVTMVLPCIQNVKAATDTGEALEVKPNITKVEFPDTIWPGENDMWYERDSVTNKNTYVGIFQGDGGCHTIVTSTDNVNFSHCNLESQLEKVFDIEYMSYLYPYQVECYNDIYYILAYYYDDTTGGSVLGFSTQDLKEIKKLSLPNFEHITPDGLPQLNKIGKNFIYTAPLEFTNFDKACGYYYIGTNINKLSKVNFPSIEQNKLYQKYKKKGLTTLYCTPSCSDTILAVEYLAVYDKLSYYTAFAAQSSNGKSWCDLITFDKLSYIQTNCENNGTYLIKHVFTDQKNTKKDSIITFYPRGDMTKSYFNYKISQDYLYAGCYFYENDKGNHILMEYYDRDAGKIEIIDKAGKIEKSYDTMSFIGMDVFYHKNFGYITDYDKLYALNLETGALKFVDISKLSPYSFYIIGDNIYISSGENLYSIPVAEFN